MQNTAYYYTQHVLKGNLSFRRSAKFLLALSDHACPQDEKQPKAETKNFDFLLNAHKSFKMLYANWNIMPPLGINVRQYQLPHQQVPTAMVVIFLQRCHDSRCQWVDCSAEPQILNTEKRFFSATSLRSQHKHASEILNK
jgi:hypothetical protein